MAASWIALVALSLAGGVAHPMHTAVTEVAQQDSRGAATVQIRVFFDDFQAAVPLPPEPAAADSALARYLRGSFALADRAGRPVRLTCGGPSGRVT